MAAFQHVRVEGTALNRGRQYGQQARTQVRASVDMYASVFARYAGWDWPTVRREAARFGKPIAEFNPKYIEEISGIADGAGLDEADVLALNVRTEIMFAAKARQAAGVSDGVHECSSLAVLPESTQDGHVLVAQNWDWLIGTFDTVVVLEVERSDGPSFVSVVEAGMLAKTGLNSAGVGLVTNALVTNDDVGEPGVPYHVVLRAILESESISDAFAAIHQGRRSSSANYVLAQDDGLALDVEAMPGDYSRTRLLYPEHGMLFHTNHFLSDRFDAKDVTLWLAPDSPFRLERLRSLVSASAPRVTVATLQSALTDHVNHPHGVCFHPDPRLDESDREASVTSVIMDLTGRRMWVSDGIPCTAGYRELDYSRLLGADAAGSHATGKSNAPSDAPRDVAAVGALRARRGRQDRGRAHDCSGPVPARWGTRPSALAGNLATNGRGPR